MYHFEPYFFTQWKIKLIVLSRLYEVDRFNPMNYTHYGQGVTGDLGWGNRKEISKAMKKSKKAMKKWNDFFIRVENERFLHRFCRFFRSIWDVLSFPPTYGPLSPLARNVCNSLDWSDPLHRALKVQWVWFFIGWETEDYVSKFDKNGRSALVCSCPYHLPEALWLLQGLRLIG